MNFLAPLFLAGALAIALPIVFHLIRKTTKEQQPFSSLMFLTPSPPRLTRRSRLEHLLLLSLRCLILCLLALGFARPFLRKPLDPQAAAPAKRMLVLVDTSASMQRAGLWPEARRKVEALLRQATPGDQVAVSTFDRKTTSVVTFDEWNSLPLGERAAVADRKLSQASPGWSGTQLGRALIQAAEMLTDAGAKPAVAAKQIVVVSDLQEGSHLDVLQGYEWPKGVQLVIEPLKPVKTSNASLQLLAESADSTPNPDEGLGVRVRVLNAADSRREQLQIGWGLADNRSFVGKPLNVYVPPGQSRILSVSVPPVTPMPDRLILQGDDEPFDNVVYAIAPEKVKVEVLYLGADAADDRRQPLFFLQRAFQETRKQSVKVIARPPDALLAGPEVQAATLLVLTDLRPNSPLQGLRELIAGGKTALVTLKSPAAAPALAQLLGVEALPVEEARPKNYAMLSEIDFRHPLFAPFADPRFSDFTKVHFWKYRRMTEAGLGGRTVARFDSGDPALLEVPVGRGKVYVLATSWSLEDSQLALSTKFIPFLYALLEQSGAPMPAASLYLVGDTLPISAGAAAQPSSRSLRLPDGSQRSLTAAAVEFDQTTLPGIYAMEPVGSGTRFAVNLDAVESRLAPLSAEELERLGAPVARPVPAETPGRQTRLQSAELENHQKLWRWVLLATMGVLLVETLLAGRAARSGTPPSEALS
jgi:hypothetical protein